MAYKDPLYQLKYRKAYYLSHRDQIRARNKANYEARKVERLAHHAEYYAANRTTVLARCHEYYVKNKQKVKEYGVQWRASRPEKERERRLGRFGLTIPEFDQLLIDQNGMCPCCGQQLTRKIDIDHDHVTGKIRGLIHHGCNTALGLLGDTPEGVLAAYDYLVANS